MARSRDSAPQGSRQNTATEGVNVDQQPPGALRGSAAKLKIVVPEVARRFTNVEAARVVAAKLLSGATPSPDAHKALGHDWHDALTMIETRGAKGLASWKKALPKRLGKSADELIRALEDAIRDMEAGTVSAPSQPAKTDSDLGLKVLSSFTPRKIVYLWPGRLPLGKLILLAGQGGIGKTFLALDIITIVTRGRPFPDCRDRPETFQPPASCMFITAEDDMEDTIVPRLIDMGADLERVYTLETTKRPDGTYEAFSLRDIPRLEAMLEAHPEIRLVVIDPITAFLGRGTDDAKNADIREVLGPVAALAARFDIAFLALTHLNKSSSARFSDKILGSVAYNNVARVTLGVMLDPENPSRRIMTMAKNNLSTCQSALAYTVTDGVVHWESDPFEMKADDLMGASSRSSNDVAKREAIAHIRAALAHGPLAWDDLVATCANMGTNRNSIEKYKGDAGAISRREGFGGPVRWHLADSSPVSPF